MKKNINIDVAVIGGGPSGYSAAFRCSDLGLSVIIIEKELFLGGTCLNYGCIPSKSLLHLSTVIREVQEFKKYGVNLFQEKKIDISTIITWKNNIISTLSNGLKSVAGKRNIKILHGEAKFLDLNTILVNNQDVIYRLQFKNAIIATGSKPMILPDIPYKDPRIWNSTNALELSNIPENFLIIGAGIIGLEMASIYSALGSKIDLIERSNSFFSIIDQDIAHVLLNSISKKYSVHIGSNITNLESKKDGILVTIQDSKNLEYKKLYNNILVAAGRIPNTDQLNILDIGVKIDNFGFIQVDKQLRTNISHIFSIGDVSGQPMLAHKGIHEAHIAAEVISGKNHYFEPNVIPSVAYCDPEIAWIGITEQSAKKMNIDYATSIVPWKFLGRAFASNCVNSGITKLIFSKKDRKILGGIILGRNAGELISNIGLAIEMGCDAEDLELTIYPHPTLSESLNIAAQVFNGTSTDIINKI